MSRPNAGIIGILQDQYNSTLKSTSTNSSSGYSTVSQYGSTISSEYRSSANSSGPSVSTNHNQAGSTSSSFSSSSSSSSSSTGGRGAVFPPKYRHSEPAAGGGERGAPMQYAVGPPQNAGPGLHHQSRQGGRAASSMLLTSSNSNHHSVNNNHNNLQRPASSGAALMTGGAASGSFQKQFGGVGGLAAPCTVKSSPVCQSEVNHEIVRPTPRRANSSYIVNVTSTNNSYSQPTTLQSGAINQPSTNHSSVSNNSNSLLTNHSFQTGGQVTNHSPRNSCGSGSSSNSTTNHSFQRSGDSLSYDSFQSGSSSSASSYSPHHQFQNSGVHLTIPLTIDSSGHPQQHRSSASLSPLGDSLSPPSDSLSNGSGSTRTRGYASSGNNSTAASRHTPTARSPPIPPPPGSSATKMSATAKSLLLPANHSKLSSAMLQSSNNSSLEAIQAVNNNVSYATAKDHQPPPSPSSSAAASQKGQIRLLNGGSPFWSSVGSGSRQHEYPERDHVSPTAVGYANYPASQQQQGGQQRVSPPVRMTSSSASSSGSKQQQHSATEAFVSHIGGHHQARPEASQNGVGGTVSLVDVDPSGGGSSNLLHVTNLVIDRPEMELQPRSTDHRGQRAYAEDKDGQHNINLAVQYHQPGIQDPSEDHYVDVEDDLEDDEHPAIRQGRSSLIKYKANNKVKPKRKLPSHVLTGRSGKPTRDKVKQRHEHSADPEARSNGKGREKPWAMARDHLSKDLEKAKQLMEVKAALEQLSLGNLNGGKHGSTSTYSSLSDLDSEPDMAASYRHHQRHLPFAQQLIEEEQDRGDEEEEEDEDEGGSEARDGGEEECGVGVASSGDMYHAAHATAVGGQNRNRKWRAPSQETLNTAITSADEFVWIDSHNRLVEIQQVPWSQEDILRVIHQGTLKESASKISRETIARLSYYLQRVLVRTAREAQRLSQKTHKCSKYEITSAFKIVLSPGLANSCMRACLRAGAMYSLAASDQNFRQTKSARAGLNLDIGKMHHWMCSVKLGKFIQEYATVYMTAGMENMLEEMLQQSLQNHHQVTVSVLEQSIANSPDLWGVFQPYAHLSSCRTAKGTLQVPRCLNMNELETQRVVGANSAPDKAGDKTTSQVLLTTCVGSKEELEALVGIALTFYQKHYHNANSCGRSCPTWSREALHTLYHYMRCSQLEHQGHEYCIQELVYERPYMVLPPLIEWLRVTNVFCESRFGVSTDNDDVGQAARVLLPGSDHPPRSLAFSASGGSVTAASSNSHPLSRSAHSASMMTTSSSSSSSSNITAGFNPSAMTGMMSPTADGQMTADNGGHLRQDQLQQVANTAKRDAAFQLLMTGRRELIGPALQLLHTMSMSNSNNSSNSGGTTAFSSNSSMTTRSNSSGSNNISNSSLLNTTNEYGLTPLMLACLREDVGLVKLLLEAGAAVDCRNPGRGSSLSTGATASNPEQVNWTALHYATMVGNYDIVRLLLEKGASVEGTGGSDEDDLSDSNDDFSEGNASSASNAAASSSSSGLLMKLFSEESGSARAREPDIATETPLQLAAAGGQLDIVELLLSFGASPFLSTLRVDSMAFGSDAQKGSYCALSTAASHGQRKTLHKLVTHPTTLTSQNSGKEVLSLEEILAEGVYSDRPEKSPPVNSSHSGEMYHNHINKVNNNIIYNGSKPSNGKGKHGLTGGKPFGGRQQQQPPPQASYLGNNNGGYSYSNAGSKKSVGTHAGGGPQFGGAGGHPANNGVHNETGGGGQVTNLYSRFSKANVKRLQEAMYHSTESGQLEITLDLRNFGVPWSLHCWIRTLISAHHAASGLSPSASGASLSTSGLSSVTDELLQDFSKDWTEDNSTYFTDECLPVLMAIFRTCKSEATTLLLADVLSSCYGKDPIDPIVFTENSPVDQPKSGGPPRIDPSFVNNPELSDIQFRVEGRIFYAHKLVLITASYKFRSMLNSKFCEGNPPVLQINDIRYEIFDMVMQYLYKGSADQLRVEPGDVLELMAAANFFQLDGLLQYCEVCCSKLIDLDTIVSYYIHAKVYSANQLLAYSEGFLLQNLVSLLTYDDSVKRLIFGKKLQNHDVLTGLLRTLQERIRKRGQNRNKKLSL